MATGNPFWDVHNKLWGLLENTANVASLKTAGKHFTDLVPASRRIKFTQSTDRNPYLGVESSDDVPQVAIFHGRKQHPRDRLASNSTMIRMQWEVLIRTGDQRFDSLFDVEWAVFRQLVNWDGLKTSVVWNATYPVKDCNLLDVSDTMFDESANKLMHGWRAIWVGETDLWFAHSTLIA